MLHKVASLCTSAFENHAIQRRLSAQRNVALRIISVYPTVSTSAVLVLASVMLIDLLAKERQKNFYLCKELSCRPTNRDPLARSKQSVRKEHTIS